MNVEDELYGTYEMPYEAVLGHEVVARSYFVNISAVPPTWVSGEIGTSRLEHGFGVYRLMHMLLAVNDKEDRDLELASLLHDIGHTAFSHLGEECLPGYDHEKKAATLITTVLADAVKKCGCDPQRVAAIIEGTDPLSHLIAGTLDVDNIDNTQRYAMSMRLLQHPVYDGCAIARAFHIDTDKATLDPDIEPQLTKWQYVRQKSYTFIYGVNHLSRAALLRKALEVYQQESGHLDALLAHSDKNAMTALRNHPIARIYTDILDARKQIQHLCDVAWTQLDPLDLHSRIAMQLGLDERAIVSDGPACDRNKSVTVPFTDGRRFCGTTTIPYGFRRIYTIERTDKRPDLASLGLTPSQNVSTKQ